MTQNLQNDLRAALRAAADADYTISTLERNYERVLAGITLTAAVEGKNDAERKAIVATRSAESSELTGIAGEINDAKRTRAYSLADAEGFKLAGRLAYATLLAGVEELR